MTPIPGRKAGGWVAGLTHRPHEGSKLLPVSLDLLLQDVMLRHLLFQLRHAWPVLAFTYLLLQYNTRSAQHLQPVRLGTPHSPGRGVVIFSSSLS